MYQRSGDRIEKFSITQNGIIQYDLFSVGETILKDHGRRGGTDEEEY